MIRRNGLNVTRTESGQIVEMKLLHKEVEVKRECFCG